MTMFEQEFIEIKQTFQPKKSRRFPLVFIKQKYIYLNNLQLKI